MTDILSRREMEERLAERHDGIEAYPSAVPAERQALEGMKRLAEWLEWTNRARFKTCRDCPARWPNGCVQDWETCEVEAAKGVAWLEDKDDG